MDAQEQFWVRVLLYDDILSCVLESRTPFYVSEGPAKPSIAQFHGGEEVYTIRTKQGKFIIDGKQFTTNEILVQTRAPCILTMNGSAYRGKLRLFLNPDGASFDVINVLPLEAYLLGVVGAEMPDYWEPEALKAQAVAARTYCLYIKNRFGKDRRWDVTRTTANQVYEGVQAESKSIWDVITRTSGMVLVSEDSGRLIPAYYSSVCGGHTEDSVNVFGPEDESLQGVPCPYCKHIVKSDLYFWPTVKFDVNTVSKKLLNRYPSLAKLGDIIDINSIKPSTYNSFSRPTYLKVIGSTGKSDTLRAEDFRLTVDPSGMLIKSSTFNIEKKHNKWIISKGRGFGHSVGMCQSGAQGMAREGKSKEQILMYYYPGTTLKNIYE